MSKYNIQMNKYNALNAEYDQLYPVTKIKNVDGLDTALQSKPNPNLLDNWYFGNPVDQRQGYVVPPGTTYFDTWGGQATGVTDKYYTATHTPGGYDDQYQITVNGAVKYVPVSSCVRGYTTGYGPDRWLAYTPISAEISSAGLILHMTNGTTGVIAQILEEFLFNELVGKVCTFSVLFADGTMRSGSAQVSPSETTLFINDYPAFGQCYLQKSRALQIYFTQERTIKAVKLELGNTQTLAHQDENGNWVLNEIPDYGEQLARCQRYFQKYDNYIWFTLCKDNLWRANFNFPVTMRKAPTVEFEVTANKETNVAFDKRTKNGISGYSTSDADYIAVTNLTFNAEL